MYCLKGLSAKVLGGVFFRLFYLTPYRLATIISSSDY